MNMTGKIIGNEDYRNKFFEKLRSLDAEKTMFLNLSNQIREAAKKKERAESKKKKSSSVTVTGATSKSEIVRLQRVLRQKMSEIISGDESQKVKSLKVSDLQNKIDSLSRILSQIERLEREHLEQRRQKKKGATEAVHLTSDDLTVNKSGFAGGDVWVSGVQDTSSVSSGIDLIAGFEAAINDQASLQNIDMQV